MARTGSQFKSKLLSSGVVLLLILLSFICLSDIKICEDGIQVHDRAGHHSWSKVDTARSHLECLAHQNLFFTLDRKPCVKSLECFEKILSRTTLLGHDFSKAKHKDLNFVDLAFSGFSREACFIDPNAYFKIGYLNPPQIDSTRRVIVLRV